MQIKKYKSLIQYIIAIVCIAYVVYFLLGNKQQIKQVLSLRPFFIITLSILICLDLLINSLRMRIVLEKCNNTKLPFARWLKIFLLARFLNTAIPQLGNLYRGVTLKQNFGISYTNYISSLAAFGWIDTIINLTFAFVIIISTNHNLKFIGIQAWLFLGIVIIMIVVGPIVADAIIHLFKIKTKTLSWIHSKLTEVFSISVKTLKDINYLSSMLIVTFIAFVITISMFYICFLGIDVPASLAAIAIFFSVLRLGDIIVITPGNVGVREIIFGMVTAKLGFNMIDGILVSTILRVLGTVIIFIAGSSLGGIGILRHRRCYVIQKQTMEK